MSDAMWSALGKTLLPSASELVDTRLNSSHDHCEKVGQRYGQPVFILPGHTSYVEELASPDGQHPASVSLDGSAQPWDTMTGQELLTLTSSTFGLGRHR